MLFQRVNRTDPEKVFVVAKNSYSTASLSDGQPVNWDYATDADGVGVTKPGAIATHAGTAIAGVAAATIASGSYGLIQVYGYHSATRVRATTSAGTTAVAGTPLTSANLTAFTLEACSTASTVALQYPCGFALAAQASWTTKTIAVFLKCM